MSNVDHAPATSGSDVEPLRRAARAEVARLSLAVRAARREAELRERDAADLDDRARAAEAVLEESLRDLIQERRRERARDLVEQRAEAERAIERVVAEARERPTGWAAALQLKDALVRGNAAREAAAPWTAEAEQRQPLMPPPAPRLRVVGADVVGTEPDPTLAAADPLAANEPAHDEPAHDEPAHDEPAHDEPAHHEPASPPAAGGSPAGTPRPSVLDSSSALVSANELREIVQAAVSEGLRQAIEHAVATMHLVPGLGRAPDVRPVPDRAAEVVDGPSFVRRLLYLDVMLPLVAAVIVLVLLLAWTS